MNRASLVAQTVKNLPATWKTWVGKILWRHEWLPASVFLPGEFQGQRSLAGYSSWGHKESDTTEQLTFSVIVVTLLNWIIIVLWRSYNILLPKYGFLESISLPSMDSNFDNLWFNCTVYYGLEIRFYDIQLAKEGHKFSKKFFSLTFSFTLNLDLRI